MRVESILMPFMQQAEIYGSAAGALDHNHNRSGQAVNYAKPG